MNHIISLSEWMNTRIGTEYVELANSPIINQLKTYETSGTGIGFIIVLAMNVVDNPDNESQLDHFELVSIPVVKINNQWITMENENVSDILSSIIRLIASSMEKGE